MKTLIFPFAFTVAATDARARPTAATHKGFVATSVPTLAWGWIQLCSLFARLFSHLALSSVLSFLPLLSLCVTERQPNAREEGLKKRRGRKTAGLGLVLTWINIIPQWSSEHLGRWHVWQMLWALTQGRRVGFQSVDPAACWLLHPPKHSVKLLKAMLQAAAVRCWRGSLSPVSHTGTRAWYTSSRPLGHALRRVRTLTHTHRVGALTYTHTPSTKRALKLNDWR